MAQDFCLGVQGFNGSGFSVVFGLGLSFLGFGTVQVSDSAWAPECGG